MNYFELISHLNIKDMKQSSILTIGIYALLFFCTACTDENEKADTAARPVPLVVRATASGFDFPEDTAAPHSYDSGNGGASVTRTPTEDGLNTVFSTGDKIGLFAIKDNAIIDGIDNLCLTYDADTGEWNPPAGKVLYYYDGVTYLAYYPYNSAITANGASAKTENDIKTYLTAHANLQPKADQSSPESYTASDLMIASGTSADVTTDTTSGERSFDLKFTHQFSLLVLVPQMSDYVAPAGHTYTYWPGAVSATLNDITPYRMADGSYRAIVPPTTTASTLHGSYEDATGKTVAYQSEPYSSGFAAGGCYKVLVSKSASGTPERAVAVGDFYMQNGMIVAGDKATLTDEEQANCIGVVFKVGVGSQDDASRYDSKLTAIHGYVMSLDQAHLAWGDNSKGWTGTSWLEYEGYVYTKLILAGIAEGKSFPAFEWCINHTPVPAGVTSGWYFPSNLPVADFTGNAAALNASFSKVKGGVSISGYYISASEGNDRVNNCLMKLPGSTGTYKNAKTTAQNVRATLTF